MRALESSGAGPARPALPLARPRERPQVTGGAQALVSCASGGGDTRNIVGSHEKSCLGAARLAQDLQGAQRFHQRCSFGERCQEEEGSGFFTQRVGGGFVTFPLDSILQTWE